MKTYRLFTINPGSTSTKIALFENDKKLFFANVEHDAQALGQFNDIADQLGYRIDTILEQVENAGFTLEGMNAFAGRGGGLVACNGGVYEINDILYRHAKVGFTVKHPATLGAQIALEFSKKYGGRAFVVNPPDVDEFQEVARVTGLKGLYRESRIHALNQKEIAVRYANKAGKAYEELNLIICHIGGGISITAHQKGRMIDSSDNANGDGPMAPTRVGQAPLMQFALKVIEEKLTPRQVRDMLTKTGGLVDHLGTSDVLEVKERIAGGDKHAELIYKAMHYQIGKTIGAYAAVLKGRVDAIIVTGGIARDQVMIDTITDMCGFIAPVEVMPGEFEMEALAAGALRVLRGEEAPMAYTGIPVWDGFSK